VTEFNANFRDGVGLYYDLVKADVGRIVLGPTFELRERPVTVVGVTRVAALGEDAGGLRGGWGQLGARQGAWLRDLGVADEDCVPPSRMTPCPTSEVTAHQGWLGVPVPARLAQADVGGERVAQPGTPPGVGDVTSPAGVVDRALGERPGSSATLNGEPVDEVSASVRTSSVPATSGSSSCPRSDAVRPDSSDSANRVPTCPPAAPLAALGPRVPECPDRRPALVALVEDPLPRGGAC